MDVEQPLDSADRVGDNCHHIVEESPCLGRDTVDDTLNNISAEVETTRQSIRDSAEEVGERRDEEVPQFTQSVNETTQDTLNDTFTDMLTSVRREDILHLTLNATHGILDSGRKLSFDRGHHRGTESIDRLSTDVFEDELTLDLIEDLLEGFGVSRRILSTSLVRLLQILKSRITETVEVEDCFNVAPNYLRSSLNLRLGGSKTRNHTLYILRTCLVTTVGELTHGLIHHTLLDGVDHTLVERIDRTFTDLVQGQDALNMIEDVVEGGHHRLRIGSTLIEDVLQSLKLSLTQPIHIKYVFDVRPDPIGGLSSGLTTEYNTIGSTGLNQSDLFVDKSLDVSDSISRRPLDMLVHELSHAFSSRCDLGSTFIQGLCGSKYELRSSVACQLTPSKESCDEVPQTNEWSRDEIDDSTHSSDNTVSETVNRILGYLFKSKCTSDSIVDAGEWGQDQIEHGSDNSAGGLTHLVDSVGHDLDQIQRSTNLSCKPSERRQDKIDGTLDSSFNSPSETVDECCSNIEDEARRVQNSPEDRVNDTFDQENRNFRKRLNNRRERVNDRGQDEVDQLRKVGESLLHTLDEGLNTTDDHLGEFGDELTNPREHLLEGLEDVSIIGLIPQEYTDTCYRCDDCCCRTQDGRYCCSKTTTKGRRKLGSKRSNHGGYSGERSFEPLEETREERFKDLQNTDEVLNTTDESNNRVKHCPDVPLNGAAGCSVTKSLERPGEVPEVVPETLSSLVDGLETTDDSLVVSDLVLEGVNLLHKEFGEDLCDRRNCFLIAHETHSDTVYELDTGFFAMHSVFVLVTLTNSLLVATLRLNDLILFLLSVSDSLGLLRGGLGLLSLTIPSLGVCFLGLYLRVREIFVGFTDSLTGLFHLLVDPTTLFLSPLKFLLIVNLSLLDRSGVCGLGVQRELLEALVEGGVLHSLNQIVCESLTGVNRSIV